MNTIAPAPRPAVEETPADPVAAPRWVLPLVAVVALGVRLPYAFVGPKFLLDDYWTLWFRRSLGILGTGGWPQLSARPGAWLSYLVEFGLIGHHPLVGYGVLVVVNVVAGVLLYRCLARFLSWQVALATSLVWAVLPNHASLDHWLSTVNIVIGLCLFLHGMDRLTSAVRAGRGQLGAVLLLSASALFYEATLPVAACALVGVPLVLRCRIRWRALTVGEVVLGSTGLWMLMHTLHSVHGGLFDYASLPTSLFGSGLTSVRPLATLLILLAMIVVTVSVARLALPSFRSGDLLGPRLVVVGVCVIVLGTIAFARDPISPAAGLGDRVNQIAAIGAALVWVGGAMQLARWRHAANYAIGLLLAVGFAGHIASDHDYHLAGEDNSRIIAAVLVAHPRPVGHVLVVGPSYLSHHRITGMIGPEGQAFSAITGDPAWHVWVAISPQDFTAVPLQDRITVLPAGSGR